jgi:serine/threonine-protein kinase RsbW
MENTLDETLVSQLDPVWTLLMKNQARHLILDFQTMEHYTPFGLGLLIGLINSLPLHISDLWVAHCSQKLKQDLQKYDPKFFNKVHETSDEDLVGLLPLKIHSLVDHFTLLLNSSDVISGQPFTLRIEAKDQYDSLLPEYTGIPHLMASRGMISPTLLPQMQNGVWEGKVIVSGPGLVTLRVWDDLIEGQHAMTVREEGEKISFPFSIQCPGCGKSNVVSKADVTRCVTCNYIYFVDLRGHVIPLKPGLPQADGFLRQLNFKIPSDINYLNLVRNFIVGIAREEKINEEQISQIEMALDEALANVVEHAYAYDSFQDVEINIRLHPEDMEIIITDQGRAFNSDKTPLPNLKEHIEQRRVGGLGRYLMKTLMDEVEYRRLHHTNELRMLKRFSSRSES